MDYNNDYVNTTATYVNYDGFNMWRSVDLSTATCKVSVGVKIETIGGRVEELGIEPNEVMKLEAEEGALFLCTKDKKVPIAPINDMIGDYGRYFMQRDKIDAMVRKANELKNSIDPMQRAIGQELVKILKDYGLVN